MPLPLAIRPAAEADLCALLDLYTHLGDNPMPAPSDALSRVWADILQTPNHHILAGWAQGRLAASCALTLVPNLTHAQRPYALIENVVTHPDFRGQGFATRMLGAARDMARAARCYKIMLLTGSKREETLKFYENAGYNRRDKTAFIQWLDAE